MDEAALTLSITTRTDVIKIDSIDGLHQLQTRGSHARLWWEQSTFLPIVSISTKERNKIQNLVFEESKRPLAIKQYYYSYRPRLHPWLSSWPSKMYAGQRGCNSSCTRQPRKFAPTPSGKWEIIVAFEAAAGISRSASGQCTIHRLRQSFYAFRPSSISIVVRGHRGTWTIIEPSCYRHCMWRQRERDCPQWVRRSVGRRQM